MLSKHDSTALYSAEQMHDKSLKLSQEDFFSTCATQANKHAGGVAKTWGMAAAIASKAETFKPCIFVCVWCSEWRWKESTVAAVGVGGKSPLMEACAGLFGPATKRRVIISPLR